MSTPSDIFLDWLQNYSSVSVTGYTLTRGMWFENAANSGKKFMSIFVDGGRSPGAGVITYATIRVVLTGTKDGRSVSGQVSDVEQKAHAIMRSALSQYKTSCAINVRPLSSVQGPFFTEENRPWYEINFELVM